MRYRTACSLFLVIFFLAPQSFAETLTLSTYYPAPEGRYAEMRAQRMAVGAGAGYIDGTTVIPDGTLLVEGKVQLGESNQLAAADCNDTTKGSLVLGNTDGVSASDIHVCDGIMWKKLGGNTSDYDSGWRCVRNSVNTSSSWSRHNFAHGLGVTPHRVEVMGSDTITGCGGVFTGQLSATSPTAWTSILGTDFINNISTGPVVYQNVTNIQVHFGGYIFVKQLNNSTLVTDSAVAITSGVIRVLAWKEF